MIIRGRGLELSITRANFGQLVLTCPTCWQLKHLTLGLILGSEFVNWVVFGRLLFVLTFRLLLRGKLGGLFPCPLLNVRG